MLLVALIFAGVKLIGGIFPGEDEVKMLNKVTKDQVVGDDGISHLVYRTDKWNLVLLNKWNPVSKDMKPPLVRLDKGHEMDSRCKDDFLRMMKDCKDAGNAPMVVSAYRTFEMQQTYYDGQVENLIKQGKSYEEAKREAAEEVAVPGTSEHHLGLAVDIVDENMEELDESQEETTTQKWLTAKQNGL